MQGCGQLLAGEILNPASAAERLEFTILPSQLDTDAWDELVQPSNNFLKFRELWRLSWSFLQHSSEIETDKG